MEATPSLTFANKCGICWWHHKNSMGSGWRWKTDKLGIIIEEAIQTHVSMMKEMKGIPGIQMDWWAESHPIWHCTSQSCTPGSTSCCKNCTRGRYWPFWSQTNSIPRQIRICSPSCNFSQASMHQFCDAWDKFSLASLKHKGQRSVAIDSGEEMEQQEDQGIWLSHCHWPLFPLGGKGVTFCRKSDASNLNMSNTPLHHKVMEFTKELKWELDSRCKEGGLTNLLYCSKYDVKIA